jgi:hypothetical protein
MVLGWLAGCCSSQAAVADAAGLMFQVLEVDYQVLRAVHTSSCP